MDEPTARDKVTVGPSLAGTLLRRGRHGISRSFRLHRPRGAFCARGYCHQCPVRAAYGGTALACELGPADGFPSRVDLLRPIGLLAERMPPWFYERRFGRPRRLRQAYLRILRSLSSAPLLPERPPADVAHRLRELETEALVVGGGPAGIAAAAVLAARGRDVTLVEREAALGGSARFVSSRLPGLREALEGLRASNARILPATTCLGLYDEEGVAGFVDEQGPTVVRFDRLVVATGAYDRLLPYRGNDLPGTIGVRAFERFLAEGAFRPRMRIGVFAAPEEAARAVGAAREAHLALAFVAGPGALPESGVPSFPGTRLLRAGERGRVTWLDLAEAGRRPCDVLVLGFTQPTVELQVQAGYATTLGGSPGQVLPEGESSFPMLVVGEAAGHLDPDRIADEARAAAVAWDRGEPPTPIAPRNLPSPAERSPEAFVCLCEDVRVRDVEAAVAEGFGDTELVKRRTGAGTGPCQGKLCLAEVAALLGALGLEPALPTVRPPLLPVPLTALAARTDG